MRVSWWGYVRAKRPVPAWRPLVGLIRSLSARCGRDPSQSCRQRSSYPDRLGEEAGQAGTGLFAQTDPHQDIHEWSHCTNESRIKSTGTTLTTAPDRTPNTLTVHKLSRVAICDLGDLQDDHGPKPALRGQEATPASRLHVESRTTRGPGPRRSRSQQRFLAGGPIRPPTTRAHASLALETESLTIGLIAWSDHRPSCARRSRPRCRARTASAPAASYV